MLHSLASFVQWSLFAQVMAVMMSRPEKKMESKKACFKAGKQESRKAQKKETKTNQNKKSKKKKQKKRKKSRQLTFMLMLPTSKIAPFLSFPSLPFPPLPFPSFPLFFGDVPKVFVFLHHVMMIHPLLDKLPFWEFHKKKKR